MEKMWLKEWCARQNRRTGTKSNQHHAGMSTQQPSVTRARPFRRDGEDMWFGGADPRREGVARGD